MTKKFITFEGIDGSGKTRVLKSLKKYLKKHYSNLNYIFTREPGGNANSSAEKIRRIILDKKNVIDSKSEALLYASARRLHLEQTIWPALKQGKVVFCDRYIDSSLAYQGKGRKLGIESVKNLNILATNDTWPELTIFFKIEPKIAFKRKSKKALDRLEQMGLQFQEQIHQGFLEIIAQEPKRFKIVNANQKPRKVFMDVVKIIKTFLLLNHN